MNSHILGFCTWSQKLDNFVSHKVTLWESKGPWLLNFLIYSVLSLQGLERALDDHKILLLEAAPDRSHSPSSVYSNRVSSITPGSKKLLESEL